MLQAFREIGTRARYPPAAQARRFEILHRARSGSAHPACPGGARAYELVWSIDHGRSCQEMSPSIPPPRTARQRPPWPSLNPQLARVPDPRVHPARKARRQGSERVLLAAASSKAQCGTRLRWTAPRAAILYLQPGTVRPPTRKTDASCAYRSRNPATLYVRNRVRRDRWGCIYPAAEDLGPGHYGISVDIKELDQLLRSRACQDIALPRLEDGLVCDA